MTGMLDSMVVLSKSHESVINSVDSTKVQQAYLEMGELHVFFLDNVDEMMEMGVPKSCSQDRSTKWKIVLNPMDV